MKDTTENKEIQDNPATSCEQDLTMIKEQLVRLGADFQNYKKRVERDRAQWSQNAQASLIAHLIPIIDDFDRAFEEARKQADNPALAQWLAGFTLIHKGFEQFLKNCHVQPIEQLQTFDPELHEALMHVEQEGYAPGQIVQVLQRGFMLNGQVLRHAKVSVAK